jgi:hypothetical protein
MFDISEAQLASAEIVQLDQRQLPQASATLQADRIWFAGVRFCFPHG